MKQRESRRRRRRSEKKRCNTLFGFIIVVIIIIITTIRRKRRRRIRRNATEDGMETLDEEVEEYSWRDVVLPALIPVVQEPVELERESRQRRRGRDILVAVDHGPNSQHALHWALAHLCRLADTLHFVHVVHSVQDEVLYEVSKQRMDELAVEAFQIAMVRSQGRIVEGEAGKMICREAERLKPAALVMGTRGRGRIQSVLQGSVSEYCFRHCKAAPVIIVPGKEAGDRSVI